MATDENSGWMSGTPYEFFVQWHVTERCNLRCRHCYQSTVVSEMSCEEICHAISGVADAIKGWAIEYGLEISPSLNITGGEPLLRQDLFEILNCGLEQGFSVSLMSNGTLIDPQVARRIKDAGVSDVQISLEGLETTHDSIRGRGSFSQALSGIRELVDEGVETNVNVTASRVNVGEADALVRLARDLQIDSIGFSRLVPAGRGSDLKEKALDSRELTAFYGLLKHHRDKGEVDVSSRDPLFTVMDLEENIPQVKMPIGGCAAGIFGITICSDGTIMPCRRMNLPIGNIRETSFRELWTESPILTSLRTREAYHGGCDYCRLWPVCRGCRAVALAFARAEGKEDFLGPDLQCPYASSPRTTTRSEKG